MKLIAVIILFGCMVRKPVFTSSPAEISTTHIKSVTVSLPVKFVHSKLQLRTRSQPSTQAPSIQLFSSSLLQLNKQATPVLPTSTLATPSLQLKNQVTLPAPSASLVLHSPLLPQQTYATPVLLVIPSTTSIISPLPRSPLRTIIKRPTVLPLRTLFKVTRTTERTLSYFQEYRCNRISEKVNRFGFIEKPCCDCDEGCWKYRTCCIDVLWDLYNPMNLNKYLKKFIAKGRKYKQLTCDRILPISQTQNKHQVETLEMVSTCRKEADVTDIELCQKGSIEGKGQLLVLGFDRYLYKNEFCAKCNNIYQYDYMTLDVKCVKAAGLKNNLTITIGDLRHQKECLVVLKRTASNKKYLKKCVPQKTTGECNKRDKLLCSLYEAPTEKHKNYHCRKCDASSNPKALPEDFLKCPSRCRHDKWCYLPEERDLSKYPDTFDVSVSDHGVLQISNFRQKFPIWEFLQLPTDFKFPKDQGLEQYYLCSGRRERCCDCNKDCMVTDRKCCIDAFWNEKNPVDMETYKEKLLEESDKVKGRFCLPIYPSAESIGYISEHYMMIRSCLRNSRYLDKVSCLSDPSNSTNIPVLGADGELYASSFCAKCNFITEFQNVNMTIHCGSKKSETNDTFNLRNRFLNCNFRMLNDNRQLGRSCRPVRYPHPEENRRCSIDNPNYDLCKSYLGVMAGYANYHCLRCISNITIHTSMVTYCDPPAPCRKCSVIEKRPTTPTKQGFRYGWSFTINFSGTIANIKVNGALLQKTCKQMEIYDIAQSKCIKFTCPPDYQAIDLKCVKGIEELPPIRQNNNCSVGEVLNSDQSKCIGIPCLQEYKSVGPRCVNRTRNSTGHSKTSFKSFNGFDSFLTFISPRLYTKVSNTVTWTNETDAYFERVVGRKITFSTLAEVKRTLIMQSIDIVTKEGLSNILMHQQKTIANASNTDSQLVIAPYVHNSLVSQVHELEFSRVFSKSRICAKPMLLPYQEITFNKNMMSLLYHNETFDISNVSLWIMIQNQAVLRSVSVCKVYHLTEPCPRKLLKENEVTISDNMAIMHTSVSGIHIYQPDQYVPTTNGYFVCINTTTTTDCSASILNQNLKKLYETEYYISILGTAVSVFCYINIIATYVKFTDLRTVPGLNTCFMCVSLLIADFMFLSSYLANKSSSVCKAVAIIMHWSLLSSFTWTLVIAFDLVLRFASIRYPRDRDSRMLPSPQLFVGFLPTALVVFIAVALDNTETVNIGYGAHNICWITNLNARLAFYIIPTAIATLIALATLCYTVYKIVKEKKTVQSCLGTGKRSKLTILKMAVQVAIVLGVTEIVGYIQVPVSVDQEEVQENVNVAFGFLYSLIRSLRGLMLYLILYFFGFKKRHLRAVRIAPQVIRSTSPNTSISLQ